MMNYAQALLALLYVSAKPLSMKVIQETLDITNEEFDTAIAGLESQLGPESGLRLHKYEHDALGLVTNEKYAELIDGYAKRETHSELTNPQLETLSIIAYQGPISRAKLDYLRGVNSSVIVRNLLMRGLIHEKVSDGLEPNYIVSDVFLRQVGIDRVGDLPDFDAYHAHDMIRRFLEADTTL
jgi:segregation and condensation protein B